MTHNHHTPTHLALALAILLPTLSAAAQPALTQGASFTLNNKPATLTRLDTLPYVESQYTKLFHFDSPDNPRLKQLRDQYRLEDVIAPGQTEFDKQVLLLDWANTRFKKFGRPSSPARGALEILAAIQEGHSFFCSHYADVFVSAAAAVGWVDRPLALRRPDHVAGQPDNSSTEHTSTEIWSNQYKKWILFDPTFAMYIVLEGDADATPLSAWEVRQEWFYKDGKDLIFVLGKDRQRFRKTDFPVFRHRYAGFGDLNLDPSAINPYAFIGYIPNTNLMDTGPDYGHMFISKDKLCDNTKWHQRQNPKNPATDPYFPINQSNLTLTTTNDSAAIQLTLKTMTPNFKTYLTRIDTGNWKPTTESFTWTPHEGNNRLEVKTQNTYGTEGPTATAEIEVK